jgi:hypothetical protein
MLTRNEDSRIISYGKADSNRNGYLRSTVMEQEAKRKKLPSDTSVTVIRKCTGPKWRSATEIADRTGLPESHVARVIHLIRTTHKHRAKVDTVTAAMDTDITDTTIGITAIGTMVTGTVMAVGGVVGGMAMESAPAGVGRLRATSGFATED